MKIIFLDIDGVLNSARHAAGRNGAAATDHYKTHGFDGSFELDPIAVNRLDKLLDDTDAFLVLSSTWRLGGSGFGGIEYTVRALERNGFRHADRFVGATPRLHRTPEGEERVRGHEIQAWLDEFTGTAGGDPTVAFAILDDDSDMAHLLPKLVQTSADVGLTDDDCARVRALLGC